MEFIERAPLHVGHVDHPGVTHAVDSGQDDAAVEVTGRLVVELTQVLDAEGRLQHER